MSQFPASIVLVGAGKMGAALLSGWLAEGLEPARVVALDPTPSDETKLLCSDANVRLNPPRDQIAAPEVLVLAVKPQIFEQAAQDLVDLVDEGTLLLSIMAGKTIANIRARLPNGGPIVRCMPNTPAAIRQGVTGAVAGEGVAPEQRAAADALLSAVGAVTWLPDEALMNAVTAVSGSGPAYVFLLAESLAAAGVAAGLSPQAALQLARATVEGAGALMAQSPTVPPGDLRRNVTSPGGTTAAALDVLMAPDGLTDLMTKAVEAARRRGEALSG